jgi:DHA1 family bicyclomycin/chloramphenicol resistance-like MFS transporter
LIYWILKMTSFPTEPVADGAVAAIHRPMGWREFVAVIAGLMALTAVSTDVMLAALPAIERGFKSFTSNDRQLVISIFLTGFGIGQIAIGSISDRFGRKPILLGGLVVFIVTATYCAIATDFTTLLGARFVQGLAASAPRVVAVSVVRDCYAGRKMARVLSLAMMILIAVPILGPVIGQSIILLTSWRATFGLLVVYAVGLLVWTAVRLPETLRAPEPMDLHGLVVSFSAVLSNRQSVGYIVASAAMYGTLFSFIFSAQQILGELFELGSYFPLAFAAAAVAAAVASMANSLLVGRLGMRLISHSAITGFLIVSLAMWSLLYIGALNFWTFFGLSAVCLALLGMIFPNLNSLAMEPWQRNAGTASSVLGSTTTIVASIVGYFVGQAYNESLVPLVAGFTVCAAVALIVVAYTERGRLFGSGEPPTAAAS